MRRKTTKTELVMLAVPAEMLLEAGIFEGDPMQMYVEGCRLIIENLDDTDDFVCDGECNDCPFNEIDCDSECNDCPCSYVCDDAEANEND